MFKQLKTIILVLMFLSTLLASYPEKPITIFVHSKPGSAIDITTRQFTKIAAKYTDATFLVENKTGGSGIIAMRQVLSKKADGYTMLASTKSFISTVMLTQSGITMDDFYFLSCLVIDPEVLITNRHTSVTTLEELIEDAKLKKGKQKWLGPLVGGVDHLMAVKTWQKLGIKGEWIPFEGGSDALAALMGKHGIVYVGNPVDVKGRPDLQIAAVATEQRLSAFPDVPTFIEKGFDVKDDVLWRGYALKKGTDPQAISFLDSVFRKVSADSEWLAYVNNTSANPVYLGHAAFTEMVQRDQKEAKQYLELAGVVQNIQSKSTAQKATVFFVLFVVLILMIFILYKFKNDWFNAEVVIGLILIFLSVFLYWLTLDFPEGKLSKTAGPAAMPRFWIYGLVAVNMVLIVNTIKMKEYLKQENGSNLFKSLGLVGLMVTYLFVVNILGYYLSTFLFLSAGAYLLGYRKHLLILTTAIGFSVFSYFIFYKILQVPLPMGMFG